MINGIEELLGEIDKFKDSVQDTVELSSALNNSAEEIKKNTELLNRISMVQNSVDKKLKLLFGVSAVGVVTSIIAVIMILIK